MTLIEGLHPRSLQWTKKNTLQVHLVSCSSFRSKLVWWSCLYSTAYCVIWLLLQVHFEKLPSYEGLCYNGSYPAQTMLKIQMYFARDKDGWTFDIGDSWTNNGWGK